MNRRNLVKAGLSSVIYSSMLLAVTRAPAAQILISLIAEAYTKTLVDGSTVTAWRLRDAAGSSLHQLSANLKLNIGDTLVVNLQNNLDQNIQLTMPGESLLGQSCPPGANQDYTLSATTAGTFLLCATDDLSRFMGLVCPVAVSPNQGNKLRDDGRSFNREYTLLLHDSDTALHQARSLGQNFLRQDYRPNYFYINGLSFPDTGLDNYRIKGQQGEIIALRLINAGSVLCPMHVHGYHVWVESRNRIKEQNIIEKDTVLLHPLECVDILFELNQGGLFPLHSHYLPSVTNNGIYSGGCVALIEASA